MKKCIIFYLLLLFATAPAISQNAEINLANWAQKNPIEKVYLHLDRQSYHSGQTVWFKAYFLSDYIPSVKNTTLYVELLNNQSAVISRKIFPAYMGMAIGQIDLPETLVSGSYQLRAYTPLMLNQPGFWYSNRITVYGKEAKPAKNEQALQKAVTLSFFPEGGNLITSLLNIVAFKAVDENGLPVNVQGFIKNNKGETITEIKSAHNGMGVISLIPQPNENYYAELNNNPSQKYSLPAATTKGIVFNVRNSARGKEFKINQLPADETFKAAYMIGQMQNTIVLKQNFNTSKDLFGGVIQTEGLFSGILHLTIFNKAGMPLAERITFVNNKEYILPATLNIDTLHTGERGKNHFSLQFKDTVIGNFSVAITDADFEETTSRTQNIYSSLLLTDDIKGYVHEPAYYFSSAADSVGRALELVMMTNGWTRFKWTDAAANTLPQPLYKDPGYISLSGKVNIEGTRKPFGDKDLLILFKPADTTLRGSMQMIHTDAEGGFKMDSVIFYDKANILFSDIRGRKSKFITVKMDADSLNKKFALEPLRIPYKNFAESAIETKMQEEYRNYLKADGLMLENVTVKGRIKSQQEQLDEKYTSGMFAGGINSRTLDLTKEIAGGMNIFDYLQGRLPGLTVSRGSEGYSLSYREGGFGRNNVTLYLDEMQTDAAFIESIPVNQIAYVKLIPNFVGSFGGATSLAIYMKKGAELSAVTSASTDIINYNGYTVIKEFYKPDYSIKKPEDAKADNRLTLLWNPHIYLADINPKVPIEFYNNDRTRRFKIVAEGITNDGRLLMIEKTIESGKQ